MASVEQQIAALEGQSSGALREQWNQVTERLAQAFDDPIALLASAGLPLDNMTFAILEQRGKELAARIRQADRDLVRALLMTVRVERSPRRSAWVARQRPPRQSPSPKLPPNAGASRRWRLRTLDPHMTDS